MSTTSNADFEALAAEAQAPQRRVTKASPHDRQLTVRFSDEEYNQLREIALHEGTPVAATARWLMNAAIGAYLVEDKPTPRPQHYQPRPTAVDDPELFPKATIAKGRPAPPVEPKPWRAGLTNMDFLNDQPKDEF